MESDIKNILRGITAIYKQLDEIQAKLNEPPVVITQAAKPAYAKYGEPKFVTAPQLKFIRVLLAKHPDKDYISKILVKYDIKNLEDLYSKEAGELITELKGS